MPLMKFHLVKGSRSPDALKLFLDTAHDSMVRSFGVPVRDRYQIVQEHEPTHFIAQDTGLDIPRTEKFVLLEIVSRPRTQDEKRSFYANLCADLQAGCGLEPTDLMISFVQNTDDDWSFGLGRAQFVEGDL